MRWKPDNPHQIWTSAVLTLRGRLGAGHSREPFATMRYRESLLFVRLNAIQKSKLGWTARGVLCF